MSSLHVARSSRCSVRKEHLEHCGLRPSSTVGGETRGRPPLITFHEDVHRRCVLASRGGIGSPLRRAVSSRQTDRVRTVVYATVYEQILGGQPIGTYENPGFAYSYSASPG